MVRTKRIFPFVLIGALLTITYFYQFAFDELPDEFKLLQTLATSEGSSICRVKPLDPFDESIRKYIETPPKRIECTPIQERYAELENGTMRILKDDVKCRFRTVEHNSGVDDFEPKYGDWVDIVGERSQPLTSDFVQVECFKNVFGLERNVFRNTLAQIAARNVSTETGRPFARTDEQKLNVLIIGIDGVSRSNFVRQMPKTLSTMEKLGFVTMDSHAKLGDNTFPNLCAVLLGKRGYLSEEFPSEVDGGWGIGYDNWTEFMWRRFARAGYATLFSEDKPEWGTFTYKRKSFGFVEKPPTDHYQRPFFLSVYGGIDLARSSQMCFDDTPLHMLQLHYIEQFHRSYSALDVPTFSFMWNVELAHEYLNTLGGADDDFSDFLSRNTDLFKDTAVIIMSDHGNRYAEIRKTVVGRMESRLPILSIRLPEKLVKNRQDILENLRGNSKKFTTHFDTHEMLNDILKASFSSPSHSSRGFSLLGNVPENRTCPQLNIPDTYCPCYDEVVLPVEKGVEAGRTLVSEVNRMIAKGTQKGQCLHLELADVLSATVRLPPKGIIRERSMAEKGPQGGVTVIYRVSIRTTAPSGAVLEGVLYRDLSSKEWRIDGDVERNNKYGNTSWCVSDRTMQKFCYCTEQHH